MTVNYPLGDALVRIKNAYLSRKETVEIPYSRLIEVVVKLLQKEKFLSSYRLLKDKSKSMIVVELAYSKKEGKLSPALRGIKLISKPGRRIYVSSKSIPPVFSGLGINIISTSQGVLTGAEAKKKRIGGELICQVW